MDIFVIVADDHTLFRAGLTRMLASLDGVHVAAEAANAGEVLALIEATQANLLMLDLSMPGASGVSLIEQVRDANPALPILVLSMHDEPALVKKALKAGAAGGRYVAPEIGASLAADFGDADRDRARQLTPRELEILRLIAAQGYSLVQIAERLGLSPKTVTTHKTNIMTKLGVANNLELIRHVVDHRTFG